MYTWLVFELSSGNSSSWGNVLIAFSCISFPPDGKFHLLPTGELLIHNLQESDESQSFRCRSMHRLTRQVVVSSPTRLRINCEYTHAQAQAHGQKPQKPRFQDHTNATYISINSIISRRSASRHHFAERGGAHGSCAGVAGRGRGAPVRRPGLSFARIQVCMGIGGANRCYPLASAHSHSPKDSSPPPPFRTHSLIRSLRALAHISGETFDVDRSWPHKRYNAGLSVISALGKTITILTECP